MPNYNESSISGTEWQRCHTVTIQNPLGGVPHINFSEERVISMGGESITKWVKTCGKDFDMEGGFPLLDPATNMPTGAVMSHAALYVALYSLYMQTAAERDAAA